MYTIRWDRTVKRDKMDGSRWTLGCKMCHGGLLMDAVPTCTCSFEKVGRLLEEDESDTLT